MQHHSCTCGAIFVCAVWFILLSLEWYIKPSLPYPVFSPQPQCLILISHRRLCLVPLSTMPSSFLTPRIPSASRRRNFQIYQVFRLSHADPEGRLHQSYHYDRRDRRRLEVQEGVGTNLSPFHRFSPTLKSLVVISTSSLPLLQLFNLISSLPFLEDLTLFCGSGNAFDLETFVVPSSSTRPPLTGILNPEIETKDTAGLIKGLLLEGLPNGVQFRTLRLD